jgi:AmpD protein
MTHSSLWQQGWYRHARALASPNVGARPANAEVDLVVIHAISLPPGEYGGPHVQSLFTNQLDPKLHPYFDSLKDLKVSAHFYIQRGGELWQFASCDDRAWHAGESMHLGRSQCNDFSIGIELEGIDGDVFTDAQYESLLALLPVLRMQYPIQHVAGHEHIAPGRKKDPGRGFSWRFLQQSLGWPDEFFSTCDSTFA